LLYFDLKHLYCLDGQQLLWVINFDLGPKINVNEIIEDKQGVIWLCLAEGLGLRRYRDLNALKNGIYDQYFEGLSIANMLNDSQGEFGSILRKRVFIIVRTYNYPLMNTALVFPMILYPVSLSKINMKYMQDAKTGIFSLLISNSIK
jgi:hypothetical protein